MSVEFENDQHKSILYAKLLQQSEEVPSLVNWLTKSGIAKTPEGANRILVCVMIISFCMTGVTVYRSFTSTANTNIAIEQDKKGLEEQNRLLTQNRKR